MSSTSIHTVIAAASVSIAAAITTLPRVAEAVSPTVLPADLVAETIYRPECPEADRDFSEGLCQSRM